jgi:hypothetical protein
LSRVVEEAPAAVKKDGTLLKQMHQWVEEMESHRTVRQPGVSSAQAGRVPAATVVGRGVRLVEALLL